MREVPEHERAGVVRGPRETLHVEDLARAEVHVGEQEQGDVVAHRGAEAVPWHEPQLDVPEESEKPLGHVEIGGEVRLLGDDHAPPGPQPQAAGQELEDVDGR